MMLERALDPNKLGPVMFLYLKPIPGYREYLKDEFAALSRSVWKDETKTRCHYWLYPEDNENEIRLIDLYTDLEGMESHATSDLAFVTFRRIEQFGVSLDLDELARRRKGLPPISSNRAFKPEGVDIDYLSPAREVPSFLGTPKLDEKQLSIIFYITSNPDKRPEVAACLASLAGAAKKAGALTFWVNEGLKGGDKFWIVTRFASDKAAEKYSKDKKVREFQAQLEGLATIATERCRWANQGFFQKL